MARVVASVSAALVIIAATAAVYTVAIVSFSTAIITVLNATCCR